MSAEVGIIKEVHGLVGIRTPGTNVLREAKVGEMVYANDLITKIGEGAGLVFELKGGRTFHLGQGDELLIDESVYMAAEDSGIEQEAPQVALEEELDIELEDTAAGEEVATGSSIQDMPPTERADTRGDVDVTLRGTSTTGGRPDAAFTDRDGVGPDVQPDVAITDEGTAVVVDVLANDTDINPGDTLTITGVSITEGTGSVSIVDGKVVYSPDGTYEYLGTGESAEVVFEYTVADSQGTVGSSSVTVTVSGTNDSAVITGATVDEKAETDAPLVFQGTLESSDVDNPDNVFTPSSTQGQYGDFSITEGGVWTFTAYEAFNELQVGSQYSEVFNVTSVDGTPATVTVTITGTNDGPVANADSGSVNEDGSVVFDVLANDTDAESDTLQIDSFTQPANGTVTTGADGTLVYTPDPDYNGSDSFTYTISDGQGGTDTSTVSVVVNAVNDAPVAADDAGTTYAITYTSSWDYDLNAGNDYTNEGVLLTAIGGTTVDGSGPTMGVDGYASNDSGQMIDPADGVNPAEGISFFFNEGDNVTPKVVEYAVIDFGNFGKQDTAIWTIYDSTDPNVVIASGEYTWDGNPNDAILTIEGYGQFDTLVITNGDTDSTFSIDQVLVSSHGSESFVEGATLYFTADDLLINDTDVDGDTLSVSGIYDADSGTYTDSVTLDSGAVVTLDTDGNVLYDPSGILGTPPESDSFVYQVSDSSGATDTSSVNVTFTPVDNNGPQDGGYLLIDDTSSETIDFGALSAMSSDIATIDLQDGDAAKSLTGLSPESVLNITDSDNTLQILGEAGDSVSLEGEWTYDAGSSGEEYATYTGVVNGNDVVLQIDADITDVNVIP